MKVEPLFCKLRERQIPEVRVLSSPLVDTRTKENKDGSCKFGSHDNKEGGLIQYLDGQREVKFTFEESGVVIQKSVPENIIKVPEEGRR